jgi:hypothetical protein
MPKRSEDGDQELSRILRAVVGGQDPGVALDGLSWTEAKAVLDYAFPPVAKLDKTTKELRRRLGEHKVKALREALSARVLRETETWREAHRSPFIRLTDPYWAKTLREQARLANIAREPWTGKGRERSRMETVSDRALAGRLSKRGGEVTPYMVAQWLKRMEETPREGFDGDFLSYFDIIRNAKAYKPHKKRAGGN